MTKRKTNKKCKKLYRILHKAQLTINDYVTDNIYKFYNMYVNGIIHVDILPKYVAIYYRYYVHDYVNAEKYYKLAADNGNYDACSNYVYFLTYTKKDYNNPDIEKYYKLAADNGDYTACCNYAYFLEYRKKDYNNPNIEKYYKLAIDNDIYVACNNYAHFLEYIKKDYNNPDIEKYYKLAADNGNYIACCNYAYFLAYTKKDLNNPNIEKYYKLAVDNEIDIAYYNYACFLCNIKKDYNNPDIEKYLEQAICTNIEYIIIICDSYINYLTKHTQKQAEKTEYYRQLAYETGLFNYIYMLIKLNPKPYLGEIALYSNLSFIQWKLQRRIKTTAECPICYNAPGILYRYVCFVHTYCIACYNKMQCTQKCCAQCRMREHPDYAAVFN